MPELRAILLTEKEQTALRILSEMYITTLDTKADLSNPTLQLVRKSLGTAHKKLEVT